MAKTTANTRLLTSHQFITELEKLPIYGDNSKFFNGDDKDNKFLNVRMGSVFDLAKKYGQMPIEQIGKLLDSHYYEARLGAVSIMDFQARDKKVTEVKKKELYQLYLAKHDRINNWDMVDRSAPYVVGGYLFDKDRAPLYKLAKSKNEWERRTAIVSTYFFIRKSETEDTFKIAEMLVNDKQESVNKAVGSWIREAGKKDKQRLLDFLDAHAATMPRITLRYAIEKLTEQEKKAYMQAGK